MLTADNSHAARLTRRKQKILSVSDKRSSTFKDYSIFQQQTLGDVRFIRQNPGGRVEDIPCGCAPTGPTVPEIKQDLLLENSGGYYDVFIVKYSSSGNVLWAARIGGTSIDYGYEIATDTQSNIVVSGYYTSNPLTIYDASGEAGATLDNSSFYDVFIAKYSPAGNVLWAARIGGTGYDAVYEIATDTQNNIVVTGYYNSNQLTIYDASGEAGEILDNSGIYDGFIAKYSPAGKVLWAARMGGIDDDEGIGIATDTQNNIVVTGGYSSSPLTIYNSSGEAGAILDNSGIYDGFIAKYSSTGNVLWAARMGGTDDDIGLGIATDTQNNIVVTGGYSSSPLTIYNSSGEAGAILDSSGGYDVFIAKYSPTGDVVWAARIGGIGNDYGQAIATDALNNIVVSGYYNSNQLTIYDASGEAGATLDNSGGNDGFIAKYSPTGNVLWAARMGGTDDEDTVSGISTDTQNNIVVTGYYNSNQLTIYDASGEAGEILDNSGPSGGYDGFIAKYSPAGRVLWAARMGGTGDEDGGYDVATDTQNNIVVTGYYNSNPLTIYYAR